MKLPKVKKKYATVKLSDWELLALEEVMATPPAYINEDSWKALLKKIQDAVTK